MTHDHDHDPPDYPHGSPAARGVFSKIYYCGGALRLKPLVRSLHMDHGILVDALNELVDRRWIKVVWRKAARIQPGEESRPFTDVERLIATPWGRERYRSTWPIY